MNIIKGEEMALITNEDLVWTEKERPSVHSPVHCKYTVFIGEDGGKYLQLDTYGSRNREHPEKMSQSIQIDEDTAQISPSATN